MSLSGERGTLTVSRFVQQSLSEGQDLGDYFEEGVHRFAAKTLSVVQAIERPGAEREGQRVQPSRLDRRRDHQRREGGNPGTGLDRAADTFIRRKNQRHVE